MLPLIGVCYRSLHLISKVKIETRAYTPDGLHRGTQSQEAFVTIHPGAPGEPGHYEALSHIDLPPGRYALRIAVHSSLTGTAGSVFAEVDVPNFAKLPVSLAQVKADAVLKGTELARLPRLSVMPFSEAQFQRLLHLAGA